jgi:transcriptional regulator with XRE-family HTH domain
MKGGMRAPPIIERAKIAERLRQARRDLKLTQAALAEATGLSRSAIVHYEKGNAVPGGLELGKLATALHRSPNYLLSGTEEYFSSSGPEHALVGEDITVTIPRATMCLMALPRDIQESVSALLMGLVRKEMGSVKFAAFLKAMAEVNATVVAARPEIDAVAGSIVRKFPRHKGKR